jgi:hypothetical protein
MILPELKKENKNKNKSNLFISIMKKAPIETIGAF